MFAKAKERKFTLFINININMKYTMSIIPVPTIIDDKSLINFFQGWYWITDPMPPIIIDFKGCDFIAPYGATLFAAYILWLKEIKRRKVNVQSTKKSVAGNFLLQCGFFELIGEEEASPTENREDRTVRLTRISSNSDIPGFTNMVMDILQIEDEELAGAVKYSLVELLRNVVQHSGCKNGGVAMAQYYPNTGLVDICVADMGVGIKSTINHAYPEIDSNLNALKFATLPHVSGTFGSSLYGSMGDNAGLGLFFIKQIASFSSGGFFLGSKDDLIDIWGDENGDQKKLYMHARAAGWPGTFAYLQLRRNTITEFDSILSVCRHLAAEARKYPAELALDFIEDVPELDDLVVINVIEFEENVEKAADIRDNIILPSINTGKMVVLDFFKVKFATQSFIHALMYKVIRDGQQIGATLSIARCTNSTKEAVIAVAAYAKVGASEK